MIAFSLVLKRFGLYWCFPCYQFDKITIAAADASVHVCRETRFRILSQC
jgi:hypothetical protein